MEHGSRRQIVGDMELIYSDGSGLIFTDNGVKPAWFTHCDGCGKEHNIHNMRSIMQYPDYDVIWLCKDCNTVK